MAITIGDRGVARTGACLLRLRASPEPLKNAFFPYYRTGHDFCLVSIEVISRLLKLILLVPRVGPITAGLLSSAAAGRLSDKANVEPLRSSPCSAKA